MSKAVLLNRDLLLATLSIQAPPAISSYQNVLQIDLQQITAIDSAGIAYLVQIKMQYPKLLLYNASDKLLSLAELYGVDIFFEK